VAKSLLPSQSLARARKSELRTKFGNLGFTQHSVCPQQGSVLAENGRGLSFWIVNRISFITSDNFEIGICNVKRGPTGATLLKPRSSFEAPLRGFVEWLVDPGLL